jgi:Domain of unknown function (DUF4386)
VAVLFQLLAAFTSAAIAVTFHPVLRQHAAGLALGAVAFRLIEGVFYALSAVGALILVSLSGQLTACRYRVCWAMASWPRAAAVCCGRWRPGLLSSTSGPGRDELGTPWGWELHRALGRWLPTPARHAACAPPLPIRTTT